MSLLKRVFQEKNRSVELAERDLLTERSRSRHSGRKEMCLPRCTTQRCHIPRCDRSQQSQNKTAMRRHPYEPLPLQAGLVYVYVKRWTGSLTERKMRRAEAARPKAFCVAPRMMAFLYRCFRLALASPMTATPSERAAAMPADTPGVPPL